MHPSCNCNMLYLGRPAVLKYGALSIDWLCVDDRGETIRIAPNFYNEEREIEALLALL